MNSTPAWRSYQEKAAEFFRELGMTAVTDATVDGVRTTHDIDVLVTFKHGGLDLKWIVECKDWNSRVPKSHVLTLRGIVQEVGATSPGPAGSSQYSTIKNRSVGGALTCHSHGYTGMELMDLMITDSTKAIPATASEAMEILKDVRLCFDRATPNTTAATPNTIKYGTATSSNSATSSPKVQ